MALMKTAFALRHLAFEDLGLIEPVLKARGFEVRYHEAGVDDFNAVDLDAVDLLIVLGGPIGAYETDNYPFLAGEISLIEYRLQRDLPTLGICLGAQLMANALGARVFPGGIKEIGWGPIDLTPQGNASCLRLLGNERTVLHWHGDTFDLPREAERLACNANYENQAFAFRRNALALQFHLEAKPRQLEEWYVGHAVELSAAGVSIPDLRAASAGLAKIAATQADHVFSEWLQQIDIPNHQADLQNQP